MFLIQTRYQEALDVKLSFDREVQIRITDKSHSLPSPKRPILETQQLKLPSSPKPAGNGAFSLLTKKLFKHLDPVHDPKGLREKLASANTTSPLLKEKTTNQQDIPARDDVNLEYLSRKPCKSHSSLFCHLSCPFFFYIVTKNS